MSDPQDYIWFGTNHKVKIKVTNVYKGSLPNNIETRSYLDVKGEYLFFANETEKSGISLRERGVCSPRSPSKLIEYAGNNLYFVKVLSFYKMIILIFTMGLSVLFFKVITKNIKNIKIN